MHTSARSLTHARSLAGLLAGSLSLWLGAAALAPAPAAAAAPAPACTTFVSSSGGGSGSSSGSPTSLDAAVNQVNPGDVVCLEAGTYDLHSSVEIDRSGTPSAPITFTGWGGTALLRYTGGTLDGGILQTNACWSWCGTHDLVIENLTMDGGDTAGIGVFVNRGSHNVTVRNCVIRNTGATGIALNAVDHVTAEHNLIYRAGYDQGWSSGISLWYGGTDGVYGGSGAAWDQAPGFHNFIIGNVVSGDYDNSSNHTDGNGIIVDGSGWIPPALIAENLVYQNGGDGVVVYANRGDVWVVNNTAYADGLDLQVHGGGTSEFAANSAGNVHFINNLAYGRQNGSAYTNASTFDGWDSQLSMSANIGYNGSTQSLPSSLGADTASYRYARPRFVHLPPIPSGNSPWSSATPPWSIGTDFMLLPGSPAIGAGVNPTAGMSPAEAGSAAAFLATDLTGARRRGNDIGAYAAGATAQASSAGHRRGRRRRRRPPASCSVAA